MEKIFEIEHKYGQQLSSVTVNGEAFWALFRTAYRFALLKTSGANTRQGKSRWGALLKKMTGYTLGILQVLPILAGFKKYKYVIVTNGLEKKSVNGRYIDKLFDGLIKKLDARNVLVIYHSQGFSGKEQFNGMRVINGAALAFLGSLLNKIAGRKIALENVAILEQINKEYSLSLPVAELEQSAKLFLQQAGLYQRLFRKVKATHLFLGCYTFYPYAYAGNKLGLTTVEAQHGIVSSIHPGYYSTVALNKVFFPQYLLSFGANSSKTLNGSVIDQEKIFPVGNVFLEKIYTQPLNEEITDWIAPFRLSVCVPLDYISEPYLVDFIIAAAKETPDIVYILCHRTGVSAETIEKTSGLKNIIVNAKYSFQDTVRHCDIHTATDSSCCLEALTLGAVNILWDYNGNVRRLYNGLLPGDPYTVFVDDIVGYLEHIRSFSKPDKAAIVENNRENFRTGYEHNLDMALATILKDR